MPGKLCTGSDTNIGFLPKEARAYSEGIHYRAGGTLLGRPVTDNPHPISTSAYNAWLAGWTLADDAAPSSAISQLDAPCVAVPTNIVIDTDDDPPAELQPVITLEPETGLTVTAPTTYTLTVEATNAQSYQWRYVSGDGAVPNGTSATLTVDPSIEGSWGYYCIVTNVTLTAQTIDVFVTVNAAADTTAPTVTAFVIPPISSSYTISVTTFTATDAVGVLGYLITESATPPLVGDAGWSGAAQTSYVVSADATYTLYGWAKDAAGNISSSLSDQCIVVLATGTASLSLAWSKPTANTDASTLKDLKTHKVYWGTSTGVYGDSLDLSTTSYPGMLEYDIPNLIDGNTYYVAVSAIDSEGNESALSTEFSADASIPTARTEATWTDITTLPYTISTSGNYRLVGNLTQGAGAAITVSASNVRLYGGSYVYGDADNNSSLTYANTGNGNAVLVGNALTGVEVYGFNFIRGAFASTTKANGTAVNTNGSFGTGCLVHDNDFVLDKVNAVGVRAATSLNDIELYDNTIALSVAGSSCFFIEGVSTGSDFHKVYGNVCTQTTTTGYCGFANAVAQGEYFKNTYTTTSACTQGFFIQTWAQFSTMDDIYIHDNIFNIANDGNRGLNPDGGSANWTILWNTFNDTFTGTASTQIRNISMRYGSTGHSIGYNTFNASTADGTSCIRFGGVDASWPGGDGPSNVRCYHNTVNCKTYGLEFYSEPATGYTNGTGFYSWNNTYTSTAGDAMIVAADIPITDVVFNTDTFSGTITISGTSPAWHVNNSFASGDVTGDTTNLVFSTTDENPVSNTPNAPANLGAA